MRTLASILFLSLALPASPAAAGEPTANPFRLGEQVAGSINFPGDEDVASFEALEGSKIKLTFEVVQGGAVSFLVRDSNGQEVFDLGGTLSAGESLKAKTKASVSGTYTVHVSGVGDSTGVYFISSKTKLPGSAKSKKVSKLKPKSGDTEAEVAFSGLSEATLTLEIEPKKFGGGPVLVSLLNPLGNELFATSASSATTIVEDLPLPLSGGYEVRLSGYPNQKAFAKVQVTLEQPAPDPNKIVIID